MLDAVRRPLLAGDRMPPANAGVAEKIIKPNDRLTSFERLEIYSQQYWWRLTSALAEDFRGVRAVIGERAFERLTVAYLEACPSHSWTLRNLGARLAEFLTAHPQQAAPHAALACDVARVEWAVIAAFDDPEKKAIDPQQLAPANPATLRLGVQPYVQLLELHHPVDKLLARLRQRSSDTAAASNAVGAQKRRRAVRLTARALKQPIFLGVHRVEGRVYLRRLSPLAYRLLLALRRGEALETACETATAGIELPPDETAGQIREAFALFTTLGWLCKK